MVDKALDKLIERHQSLIAADTEPKYRQTLDALLELREYRRSRRRSISLIKRLVYPIFCGKRK